MRVPLQYQFMVPLLVVSLAGLGAVAAITAHRSTVQTRGRIEDQLRGVATVLSETRFPLTDLILSQMGDLASTEFVLTDAQGRQVATTLAASVDYLAVDPGTARDSRDVRLGRAVRVGDRLYFHSSLWVDRRPQVAGRQVLHILFPQDQFNAAWRATFLPPLLVGLGTIVLAVLVTGLIAGRISRLVARLGREVSRLAEGDFRTLDEPTWNDEARDLTRAVNQTARRLTEYATEIRRTEQMRTVALLGAGLAHEMRNATTGCRLAVDLHAENCAVGGEDDSLEVAKRQLVLMESRLQRFLRLGKQESRRDQDLDVTQRIDELVALIKPAARHADIRLDWQAPQPPDPALVVHADGELLDQAFMNVLLNALDAASRGQAEGGQQGYLSIEVGRRGDEVELVVADSGEGPDPDLPGSVFDPFVTTRSEGTGLGLAVARCVVESYGGSIGWDRKFQRTEFRIRLPVVTDVAGPRNSEPQGAVTAGVSTQLIQGSD